MPTSAYDAGDPPAGMSPAISSTMPKAAPATAPRKRLGAKTPPDPPEASVSVVARPLRITSSTSAQSTAGTGPPDSMSSTPPPTPYDAGSSRKRMVSYPLPKKAGTDSACVPAGVIWRVISTQPMPTTPSRAAPVSGLSSAWMRSRSYTSSPQCSRMLKSTATMPQTAPSTR